MRATGGDLGSGFTRACAVVMTAIRLRCPLLWSQMRISEVNDRTTTRRRPDSSPWMGRVRWVERAALVGHDQRALRYQCAIRRSRVSRTGHGAKSSFRLPIKRQRQIAAVAYKAVTCRELLRFLMAKVDGKCWRQPGVCPSVAYELIC